MAKKIHAHIRKEALKFSAAHMTVFPDGSKESLHGHNYRPEVTVELSDISLPQMIAFQEFKAVMKAISDHWDEKVLLAAQCPYLKIQSHNQTEIDFLLCGKRYVIPASEVVLLPVDNVTTETLAEEYLRLFVERLGDQLKGKVITGIQMRVDEIDGQGATAFWPST
jgi:6-pyruvoyltetrahydropterin/6-carboxytetrahydropterin synthase